MGVILGSYLQQALRDGQHLKKQREGRARIARRLGISGPWQPEMGNYPAFVCAHCQFPHVIVQTMLGCKACAAPYFPAEAIMLEKKGVLTCPACETGQSVEEMPFCCTNCRCIQAPPQQPQWRRTFVQTPAWKALVGFGLTAVVGLVVLLFCLVRGQSQLPRADAAGLQMSIIFFGGFPLTIGILGLISLKLRKRPPEEMYLSCGGFGYRTANGEERWFAWPQVGGLQDKQQMLNTNTLSSHPDSTAIGWTIHTQSERLSFDNRLVGARLFAREIRNRSPYARLVDSAPFKEANPWVVVLIVLVILLCIMLITFANSK